MNQMMRSLAASSMPEIESPHHVGLIRIGQAMVAVHVDHIREVIPAPDVLFTAAIVAEGLCGMIELRGTVIPVADLRATLGLPLNDAKGHVILVLRVDNRLIGLLADEVCGIAVANPDDLHTLSIAHSKASQVLATHSFRWAHTVVTLLSAQRIIDLPGMPSVEEKAEGTGLEAMANAEPMLLFAIEKLFFGIAAHAVEATAPDAAILRSPLQSTICLGIIDYHGTEVPVVDTLRILGLSTQPCGVKTSPVLILRYGPNDLLGFVLDGVCDIPRLRPDQILPMPSLMMRRTNLFRGVFSDDRERQFLVLDPPNLQTQDDLAALASLSRKKAEFQSLEEDEGKNEGTAYRPYLTYRAGADLASRLTDIREIVEYPENFTPLEGNADGLLGLFTHRGDAIPLLCLATRLGLEITMDRSSARVLLIPDGNQTIGIVVQSLKSIESARPRTLQRDSVSAQTRFIGFDMAEFRVGDQIRLLPHIDLTQIST